MSYLIYLSGPIAGLTYRQSTEWRQRIADELEDDFDLEVLDPMRDVHAEFDTVIGVDGLIDSVSVTSVDTAMMTDRGLVVRDYQDTVRADLVIVNLLAAREKSIGTVTELAWAYDHRIPTVVVMEPTGNPHEHPFIREMSSYRVDTIERAIEVVKSVLGLRPY